MRYSELASRYTEAIYDLAKASNQSEAVLSALSALANTLSGEKAIVQFISSPLVAAAEKEKVFHEALEKSGVKGELAAFIMLLVRKDRLQLLQEIVAAYQACDDKEKSITRGTVKSVSALTERQKNEITQTITALTKKQVKLSFEEDKSLIGGLVAQVGSLTFNDSLAAHLDQIKDDLNRRTH
jgi:F-type H+-transporting ATPase subunit delta